MPLSSFAGQTGPVRRMDSELICLAQPFPGTSSAIHRSIQGAERHAESTPGPGVGAAALEGLETHSKAVAPAAAARVAWLAAAALLCRNRLLLGRRGGCDDTPHDHDAWVLRE